MELPSPFWYESAVFHLVEFEQQMKAHLQRIIRLTWLLSINTPANGETTQIKTFTAESEQFSAVFLPSLFGTHWAKIGFLSKKFRANSDFKILASKDLNMTSNGLNLAMFHLSWIFGQNWTFRIVWFAGKKEKIGEMSPSLFCLLSGDYGWCIVGNCGTGR